MKNKGFTILESIVAIAVLSLSVAGVFSAVQQGLSQAIVAKDEIRTFYLAQEAVEIIRNRRDANQLYKLANLSTSNTWLYGISQNSSDPCYFGKICRADAKDNPPTLTFCGNDWGSCPFLKQDSNSLYNYTSGNDTNFKREIKIESINANEIAVIVRVFWTKGLTTRDFKAKTILFNWVNTPPAP